MHQIVMRTGYLTTLTLPTVPAPTATLTAFLMNVLRLSMTATITESTTLVSQMAMGMA